MDSNRQTAHSTYFRAKLKKPVYPSVAMNKKLRQEGQGWHVFGSSASIPRAIVKRSLKGGRGSYPRPVVEAVRVASQIFHRLGWIIMHDEESASGWVEVSPNRLASQLEYIYVEYAAVPTALA